MARITQRIAHILRNEGIFGLAKKILRRFVSHYYLLVVDTQRFAAYDIPSDVIWRTVDESLTKQCQAADPDLFDNRRVQLFKERLENPNEHGLILLLDGEPAGYGWRRTDTIEDPSIEYTAPLPPDSVFFYDRLTFPAHRRRGVARTLYAIAARFAAEEGAKEIYQIVASHNLPQLSMIERFGGYPVARITYYRIGPWHKTWKKPLKKQLHP